MVDLTTDVQRVTNRETRVINRQFSIAEYGQSWTKIERLLFLEILNSVKNFYTAKDDSHVLDFTDDSITIALPIRSIDKGLIKVKNRTRQLMEASEGLMDKTIKSVDEDSNGQKGFYFVNMFTYIKYDPKSDKNNMELKIPKEIFRDMMPIEAYCDLDYLILDNIDTGNSVRLYEVFKSFAFKKNFTVTFEFLREQLGFKQEGKYKIWKEFNRTVLKPAVEVINKYREFDIEVQYKKTRGKSQIEFTIIQHHVNQKRKLILSLSDHISPDTRRLNLVQNKYIDTLIKNCQNQTQISSPEELKTWMISDLLSFQRKAKEGGEEFDFSKYCNYISKLVRSEKYTMPLSHEFWIQAYHQADHNVIEGMIIEAENNNQTNLSLGKD
jgi:hypothetical protein